MLCVFWLRYRNKARKVLFDCEAFPKSDLRGDKIGKWACFAPIWRNKTEEGKGHAAGPLEVEGKSDGTGGSCVALLLPQTPLLASSCITRLCLDASSSCTGSLTCRNAGGLCLSLTVMHWTHLTLQSPSSGGSFAVTAFWNCRCSLKDSGKSSAEALLRSFCFPIYMFFSCQKQNLSHITFCLLLWLSLHCFWHYHSHTEHY